MWFRGEDCYTDPAFERNLVTLSYFLKPLQGGGSARRPLEFPKFYQIRMRHYSSTFPEKEGRVRTLLGGFVLYGGYSRPSSKRIPFEGRRTMIQGRRVS